MAKIDRYFQMVKEAGASDLHLLAGLPPKLRIRGELDPIEGEPVLDHETLAELLMEILDTSQKSKFQKLSDLDFAYGLPGVARFRCNYLMQTNGIGGIFRMIPEKIKTMKDLDLPEAIEKIVTLRKGLVLVTGPTGSGKSTTLAAIIDHINANYNRHILTIEDPIEFVHSNKNSLVRQREVGRDTFSFAAGLRSALREDPDVILVGEMRDFETISLAVTLAETGQLVFGTLHTNSAAKAVDRIIDAFPVNQQNQIRTMLADSLKAVVAQQLLRKKDGNGRVAALEILFGSAALANIIREGKSQQILSVIQGGKKDGMQTLDNSLMDLLNRQLIDIPEAIGKAHDKKLFLKLMHEPADEQTN